MEYPGYVIKRGSTNVAAVKYVQATVSVTVDGVFGTNTENAVKNFQAFFGLAADGLVGQKTWGMMEFVNSSGSAPEPEPVPPSPPAPTPPPTDKGGRVMAMVQVSRNEWDVDEPARAAKRSWNDITGVEIHYTGAPGPKSLAFADKKQWLLDIERYHEQTKGWSDIFYNIFVFADGEVWEGRNPLVQSQSSLFNWLTVHVPGTTGMVVTEIQKRKIAEMTDIVGGNLRGHGERAATGCPGASALDFIHAYRNGTYTATVLEMTRFEFADALCAGMGWTGGTAVEILIERGVTSQTEATFRGTDFITRAEAATMFVRAVGEEANSLDEGLHKAVDLGFYSSVGNGSDLFKTAWFDGVMDKVSAYVAAEEAEAARVLAEQEAAAAAAEAERLEAERVAAEAEQLAAEEAAAEAARLEAEEAAAAEAQAAEEALAAAELAAREAAEAEAAAKAELLEQERLAAEAAEAANAAHDAAVEAQLAPVPEETEIPEEAELACCDEVKDAQVGGLLRQIIAWIINLFKK